MCEKRHKTIVVLKNVMVVVVVVVAVVPLPFVVIRVNHCLGLVVATVMTPDGRNALLEKARQFLTITGGAFYIGRMMPHDLGYCVSKLVGALVAVDVSFSAAVSKVPCKLRRVSCFPFL